MDERSDWETLYNAEISKAESARLRGNDGQARVCARRAVGIVLGEYFHRNNISNITKSAYDRLRYAENFPNFSNEVHSMIGHFMVRINPTLTYQ